MNGIIKSLKDIVNGIKFLLEANPGIRSLYIGDYTVLVRLKFGRRLYVDSRDIGVAQHIMVTGVWEQHYTDLVKRIVKPGDTFVDVGANFGYYSVLGGALVGSHGKVFSFEPSPRPFQLLKMSMKANGFLKPDDGNIFEYGVSDYIGEATFNFKEGDFGGGSLFIPNARLEKESFTEVTIKLSTLDVMLKDVQQIDFIKIDAEGSEVSVIKGMEGLIKRSPDLKILLEFYPKFIEKHMEVGAFAKYLLDFGFNFYLVDKSNLKTINHDQLKDLNNCYLLLSKKTI